MKSDSGIKQIAESIYALAKTDGLMTFQTGTKRLRPLTESEWQYLHNGGKLLTEGVGKLEYAVYLMTVDKYKNEVLSEDISKDICSKKLRTQILKETQVRISKAKLNDSVRHGAENTFVHKIIKKISNILS